MNFLSINLRGIGGDHKAGWIKNIRKEFGVNFLAIQESKRSNVSRADLIKFWGSGSFGFESICASGLSGGLICAWDDSLFALEGSNKNKNFLHIRGKITGSNSVINFVNVYAPQGVPAKKEVWDLLGALIDSYDGYWVIGGDFNAVRFREEKRNCSFKPSCASNFNSFIFEAGLIEFEMRGRRFTWHSENRQKMSKLDRFLVNSVFFNKWPEAHVQGFKEVVVEASNSFMDPESKPDVRLVKKLAFVRSRIKDWRDSMLIKDKEMMSQAEKEVEELEALLEIRDLSEDEGWALAENKKIIAEAELAKVKDLKQRSRVRWAKEGDENSRFFHTMINCRKASNVIHGLFIGDEWVSKPTPVKKEVFQFFRSKFQEDCANRPKLLCPNLKKISSHDADWIESRFSVEEIKSAVFECGDDRAPGPDGFNFRFFKLFWSLFEADFFALMSGFFDSGTINPGCGSSFIALIPKKRDPTGLGDYRPISLVGVVNKVVSKILANRLKKVLGSVISVSQSAFLGGRFILDGPLIINEVTSWFKRSKKKAFLFKIDFEKAYDNINWGFVVDIFNQMGFGAKWCSWIWGVLSSARASVLVNGSPTFEFRCGKGMRQGDPISPFLFVVVMEALSCIFDKAVEVGVFSGINLPNDGPSLSHLFFAGDALIIGEWGETNALNVVRILRCFFVCSGLRINLSKSNIFGIGADSEEVADLARVVGCNHDVLPFKYLGLMVGANMNKVSSWKPIYDIVESRLALWKSGFLSIGGRITLIRPVLQSLPGYYFSLYRAPIKVVKDLEGKIRKFLWGGSNEGKKTHWVSWNVVASPIKCGGLGISKLHNINIALLSKWGWRYKCEFDNLWVKVIDSLFASGSGWSFIPDKKSASGVWHNIVAVFNKQVSGGTMLRNLFKGVVGRGDQLYFWLDNWVTDIPLKDLFTRLFSLEVVKTCRVQERIPGNWLWKHDPSLDDELVEMAELLNVVNLVSLNNNSDKWVWKGDSSGVFSVASVKKALEGDFTNVNGFILDWCKWVPIKCSVFVWRAAMGRIPTSDALRRRGIFAGDGLCPLCRTEDDSADHLLTSCLIATILWQKISRWCGLPPIYAFSVKDLLLIHRSGGIKAGEGVALHGVMITACWCLWLARNKALFSGVDVKPDSVFSEVRSLAFLWYKYRSKCSSIAWVDWCKFVIMMDTDDSLRLASLWHSMHAISQQLSPIQGYSGIELLEADTFDLHWLQWMAGGGSNG
ncbi:putative RNA-directed DNA polymerase [Helianthus anomalus]